MDNMINENKKTVNSIGIRYAILIAIIIGIQIVASYCFLHFAKEFTSKNGVMISYGLTVVSYYLTAFPVLAVMLKKVPKGESKSEALGTGNFISGFFICYAIMVAGSIIGNILQIFTTGSTDTAVSQIMMGSDLPIRLLIVGIVGPIIEEFTFRKFLIDRLRPLGAPIAIIGSGIMFGLFHGNFSQFFYAFGLGLFFGCLYYKTGRIRYSIAFHIIINSFSSILGVYALQDFNARGMESTIYILYAAALYLFAFVGIILIIAKLKNFIPAKNEEDASVSTLFTTPGMYAFYATIVVLFLVSYGVIKIS